MIVRTIKIPNRKKLGGILGFAIIFVFAVIGAVTLVSDDSVATSATVPKTHFFASTNEDRIAFLASYGWEVETEPCEIKEVLIPEEFSDVYEKYNELQTSQGLDLSKYKGCRAKLWSYSVLNHPNATENVRAHLIIYDNKVIAGDIANTTIDGFMHGFEKPETSTSTNAVI